MSQENGSWSVAWAKRRIKAHWRASAKAACSHRKEFHMAEAEHWRRVIRTYAAGRGDPNVIVLDRFRPDPLEPS